MYGSLQNCRTAKQELIRTIRECQGNLYLPQKQAEQLTQLTNNYIHALEEADANPRITGEYKHQIQLEKWLLCEQMAQLTSSNRFHILLYRVLEVIHNDKLN